MTVVVAAVAVVALLVLLAQEQPRPVAPRPPDPLEALEGELMPKFRAAVASRDWAKARQLAESCHIGATRCPRAVAALEQLRVMGKLDVPPAPQPDGLPEEAPVPP